MSHKSSRFLIIAPILCIVISIVLAMLRWNPVAFTIPFVIADIIGSVFYVSQPAPTCYDEALKCAAFNKWIKLAHLLTDVTMITLHICFLNVRGYISDRVFLLDVSYFIARLFSQFATAFALGKIADGTENNAVIQIKSLTLHKLLHLLPIADVCSACWLDRQMKKSVT